MRPSVPHRRRQAEHGDVTGSNEAPIQKDRGFISYERMTRFELATLTMAR